MKNKYLALVSVYVLTDTASFLEGTTSGFAITHDETVGYENQDCIIKLFYYY